MLVLSTSIALWAFSFMNIKHLVIANDLANYTCEGTDLFEGEGTVGSTFHLRGTALGGWLVLEPWIVPSLFYQFLGSTSRWGLDTPDHVGMDSHSFCKALGPEEANRQLRRHWSTWVTEEHIKNMSLAGVETLRVPVGDWMFSPYEPFIGCWDGSLDALDDVINLCGKYGLTMVLDVHAMNGSQNGYDNSGKALEVIWTNMSLQPENMFSAFSHWNNRIADWVGDFNLTTNEYDNINYQHINFSISVVDKIVDRYKDNPVVVGVEPANEPWQYTPMNVLQAFYWECYKIVRRKAPRWITLFHDSFRLDPQMWGNFMIGCPNYAIDTHIYQAWDGWNDVNGFQVDACVGGSEVDAMEALGVPVIVGEWSLATDNCALWLNGFQDNLDGYPYEACNYVVCPDPYMGPEQPGAPPNPAWGPNITQDPRGTGESFVSYGMCPIDSLNPMGNSTGLGSPLGILGLSKLYAFDYGTHGNFFWNFRTELEPRWSFLEATANGWLPGPMTAEAEALTINTCAELLSAQSRKDFSQKLSFLAGVLLVFGIAATAVFTHVYRKSNGLKGLQLFGGGRYNRIQNQDTDGEGWTEVTFFPSEKLAAAAATRAQYDA